MSDGHALEDLAASAEDLLGNIHVICKQKLAIFEHFYLFTGVYILPKISNCSGERQKNTLILPRLNISSLPLMMN